jgi:hypothetical protein
MFHSRKMRFPDLFVFEYRICFNYLFVGLKSMKLLILCRNVVVLFICSFIILKTVFNTQKHQDEKQVTLQSFLWLPTKEKRNHNGDLAE